MLRAVQSLTAAALLLHRATAAPADQACKAISEALPDRVSLPLSIDYLDETNKYWSTALRTSDIQPACVVRPHSVDEVSTAVKILNEFPDVNFAAKSGGHSTNPGHGSVQGGVLVAMREISGTTYDAETGLAYVKPGGEWNDVVGALDPQGVTVVGGRLGIVGIGGYLLQGGISFLSAQYGLAADSVVGWETVLPNGTVANIDATKNPELAVAMRGSGSQFGIVTQYTVKAHPIGQIWGGMRIYDESQADAIYDALHNYVPGNADDPKSAVIITNLDATANATLILIFYFYDGATPPTTGPFADFLNIPSTLDTAKTQSYADLLFNNGFAANFLNARVSFRTFTIPYLANNSAIYQEITAKWKSITAPYISNPLHLTSQCSVDFQPFPSIIGAHSEAAGGNALGIRGSDGHRLLLELQCSWQGQPDDATLYAYSHEITAWLEGKVEEWKAEEGAEQYLPWLMNDAMGDQNVTGRYRAYGALKELQASVDEEGLFRTRAGGFKY